MSLVAFVPARSGSKRLPGKNVKDLAGKPLVIWTLEAFAKAPSVDQVIFSTDSKEYWALAQQHLGTEKLVLDFRAPDEAGDQIKIFDYLKNARKKIFGETYANFVLGLPTVPFRKTEHIESAIAIHNERNMPVFSATEYGFPISFAFHKDNDGRWHPASDSNPMVTGNTRSQDQRPAYHPNGAIYVRSVASLGESNLKTLYDGALPYLMDRKFSLDIDNEIDFKIAAAMVSAGILK
jgi:CMP-N,N'-diacetyllegionaminic acid synthase